RARSTSRIPPPPGDPRDLHCHKSGERKFPVRGVAALTPTVRSRVPACRFETESAFERRCRDQCDASSGKEPVDLEVARAQSQQHIKRSRCRCGAVAILFLSAWFGMATEIAVPGRSQSAPWRAT